MLWYTALTSCQRIAPSHDKQRKQLPKHMHNTCFFLPLCIVAMKFYFLFLYNSIAFFGRMKPSVLCPFTSSVAEVMAIKLWQQDSLPVRAVWGHFPCALCFFRCWTNLGRGLNPAVYRHKTHTPASPRNSPRFKHRRSSAPEGL